MRLYTFTTTDQWDFKNRFIISATGRVKPENYRIKSQNYESLIIDTETLENKGETLGYRI